MLNKKVIVIVIICICLALVTTILKDKYDTAQIAAAHQEDVKIYLEDRYEEEMCFTGDWSYYDAVYRYQVYPIQDQGLLFRAEYQANKNKCEDDFLLTYAEREAILLIQEISKAYYSHSTCSKVSIVIGLEDKMALYEFYQANGVPWDWNVNPDLGSSRWATINLYEESEATIQEDTISEMVNEIANLNFMVERVIVKIYRKEGDEKPKGEIIFERIGDGYQIQGE